MPGTELMATRLYSSGPWPICWEELVCSARSCRVLWSGGRGGGNRPSPTDTQICVVALPSPHTAFCLFKMCNRDGAALNGL